MSFTFCFLMIQWSDWNIAHLIVSISGWSKSGQIAKVDIPNNI